MSADDYDRFRERLVLVAYHALGGHLDARERYAVAVEIASEIAALWVRSEDGFYYWKG